MIPAVPYSVRGSNYLFSIATNRTAAIPFARLDRVEVAAIKIQLWYASIMAVHRAMKNEVLVFTLPKTKQILRTLVYGERRVAYMHRLKQLESLQLEMRGIVLESLEEAFAYCIRKETAVARIVEYERTSLNSSMLGAVTNIMQNVSTTVSAVHETGTDYYGKVADKAQTIQSGIQSVAQSISPLAANEEGKVRQDSSEKKSLFSMFRKSSKS